MGWKGEYVGKKDRRSLPANAVAISFVTYFQHSIDDKPITPLTLFPKQMGLWAGVQKCLFENVHEVLGVDNYFLGVYRSGDGHQIELYVGFCESQTLGTRLIPVKTACPGGLENLRRFY